MLEHNHGQFWNASTLTGVSGVAAPSVRQYLDILESTFMVVRVPSPFTETLDALQLDSGFVIAPFDAPYPLSSRARVLPLGQLADVQTLSPKRLSIQEWMSASQTAFSY